MPESFHSVPLPPTGSLPARGHPPSEVLGRVFGFPGFRGIQGEAVARVMRGEDLLAMMPTGGGKSLAFQVPALSLAGTALVVSPLVALMRDQCDSLRRRGVRAAAFVSSLGEGERAECESALAAGTLDLAYVSPERLASARFRSLAGHLRLSLVAIDEAHCVCEWGHGFRPDYLTIPESLASFRPAPRMALTASAGPAARDEVMWRLLAPGAACLSGGFDRPHIALEVSAERRPLDGFMRVLSARAPGEPAVLYCQTRGEVERAALALGAEGHACAPYHAGLPESARNRTHDAFLDGRIRVVVATSAFGMGVDKPDIGLVGHAGLPASLEAYYQESGRAGRDRRPALAWLGHASHEPDARRARIRAEPDAAARARETARLESVLAYVEGAGCRRATLLRRFGEELQGRCGACDRCLRPPGTRAAGGDGTALLAGVARMSGEADPDALADVLAGTRSPSEFGFAHLPQGGAFAGRRHEALRMFRQCAGAGLVAVDERDGTVRLLPAGFRTLREGAEAIRVPDARARPPRSAVPSGLPAWRTELWQAALAILDGDAAGATRAVESAGSDADLARALAGMDPTLAGLVAAEAARLRPAPQGMPVEAFDLF